MVTISVQSVEICKTISGLHMAWPECSCDLLVHDQSISCHNQIYGIQGANISKAMVSAENCKGLRREARTPSVAWEVWPGNPGNPQRAEPDEHPPVTSVTSARGMTSPTKCSLGAFNHISTYFCGLLCLPEIRSKWSKYIQMIQMIRMDQWILMDPTALPLPMWGQQQVDHPKAPPKPWHRSSVGKFRHIEPIMHYMWKNNT